MISGDLPLPGLVQAVLVTLSYNFTPSLAWFFVAELLLQTAFLVGSFYPYWNYSRYQLG